MAFRVKCHLLDHLQVTLYHATQFSFSVEHFSTSVIFLTYNFIGLLHYKSSPDSKLHENINVAHLPKDKWASLFLCRF